LYVSTTVSTLSFMPSASVSSMKFILQISFGVPGGVAARSSGPRSAGDAAAFQCKVPDDPLQLAILLADLPQLAKLGDPDPLYFFLYRKYVASATPIFRQVDWRPGLSLQQPHPDLLLSDSTLAHRSFLPAPPQAPERTESYALSRNLTGSRSGAKTRQSAVAGAGQTTKPSLGCARDAG
jgi:hypothetical protein